MFACMSWVFITTTTVLACPIRSLFNEEMTAN